MTVPEYQARKSFCKKKNCMGYIVRYVNEQYKQLKLDRHAWRKIKNAGICQTIPTSVPSRELLPSIAS